MGEKQSDNLANILAKGEVKPKADLPANIKREAAGYLLAAKINADGAMESSEVLAVSPRQSEFLKQLVDLRDFDKAVQVSEIAESEVEPLRDNPVVLDWIDQQITAKAKSGYLTKEMAQSILFDVIRGRFPIGKNGIKALELLGKWKAWAAEKRIHSVEEGTQMMWAWKGAPVDGERPRA